MNLKDKYIATKQQLKDAKEQIIFLQYFKNKYESMLRDMAKELNKRFIPEDDVIVNPSDEEIIDMVLNQHPAFIKGQVIQCDEC